jgi:dsRNA-specific ribonuclease
VKVALIVRAYAQEHPEAGPRVIARAVRALTGAAWLDSEEVIRILARKPKMPKLDAKRVETAASMRARGESLVSIGAHVGAHKKTVARYLSRVSP